MKAKALLAWLLGAALCTQPFILAQENAATASPQATYTVQRGDTLYSIAKRFGTTVAALRELNGLSGNAMLSPASLVATTTFFATAIVVTLITEALTS